MAASAKSAVPSSLPSSARAAVSTATDCGRSILRSMIRWPSQSIPRARCRCWTTGIIAYERSSDGGKIAGGAPSLPARQDGRDARRSTDACLLPLQLPSACGGLFFDCCAARKLTCLVHPRPCPRGQQPMAHLYMPRGLIFKMARAMSLLLHPCTSRRNTCWSRGVILISLRLITGFSPAPSVQSWGRDPPKQKQAVRQMFADQQRHLEPYSYTATCSLRAPSLTSFS
jgi:hypothetical protein